MGSRGVSFHDKNPTWYSAQPSSNYENEIHDQLLWLVEEGDHLIMKMRSMISTPNLVMMQLNRKREELLPSSTYVGISSAHFMK